MQTFNKFDSSVLEKSQSIIQDEAACSDAIKTIEQEVLKTIEDPYQPINLDDSSDIVIIFKNNTVFFSFIITCFAYNLTLH